jgi:hypothetical protein
VADIHFYGSNNFQRNALQIACAQGNEKIVHILLILVARVNEVSSTPPSRTHGSPKSSVGVIRYNGKRHYRQHQREGTCIWEDDWYS